MQAAAQTDQAVEANAADTQATTVDGGETPELDKDKAEAKAGA
jgi:hypothetical protein